MRDAALVPLLAGALPNTESRCELPGITERPGSTAEGVGRWWMSWPLSRRLERERETLGFRERGERGEREKGFHQTNGCTATGLGLAFAAVVSPPPQLFVHCYPEECSGAILPLPVHPPSPRRRSNHQPARRNGNGGFGWGRLEDPPCTNATVAWTGIAMLTVLFSGNPLFSFESGLPEF